MKLRAIDYRRNSAGEHLTVMLEPEWLGRLFGVKPRRQTYSRLAAPDDYGYRWFTGGLPTPLAMQQQLNDARDAWEHDQPCQHTGRRSSVWRAGVHQWFCYDCGAPVSGIALPLILHNFYECDCGSTHPNGWICLKGDRYDATE